MIREEEFSHRLNKNANFCGFTPLHYASLIDSYEGVKLLLQGGNINHSEIRSRFSAHLLNI
jgi:ankyrin repeat protein